MLKYIVVIPNVLTLIEKEPYIYKESNGDVKFNLVPKVKVISNVYFLALFLFITHCGNDGQCFICSQPLVTTLDASMLIAVAVDNVVLCIVAVAARTTWHEK